MSRRGLAQIGGAERANIRTLERHRARYRLDQPQERAAGSGLAAAGFADPRQRLAAAELHAHILDRVDIGDSEALRPALLREAGNEARSPRAKRTAAPSIALGAAGSAGSGVQHLQLVGRLACPA